MNNLLSLSETQMDLPISTVLEFIRALPQDTLTIRYSAKDFKETPWRREYYMTKLAPLFLYVVVGLAIGCVFIIKWVR